MDEKTRSGLILSVMFDYDQTYHAVNWIDGCNVTGYLKDLVVMYDDFSGRIKYFDRVTWNQFVYDEYNEEMMQSYDQLTNLYNTYIAEKEAYEESLDLTIESIPEETETTQLEVSDLVNSSVGQIQNNMFGSLNIIIPVMIGVIAVAVSVRFGFKWMQKLSKN